MTTDNSTLATASLKITIQPGRYQRPKRVVTLYVWPDGDEAPIVDVEIDGQPVHGDYDHVSAIDLGRDILALWADVTKTI